MIINNHNYKLILYSIFILDIFVTKLFSFLTKLIKIGDN